MVWTDSNSVWKSTLLETTWDDTQKFCKISIKFPDLTTGDRECSVSKINRFSTPTESPNARKSWSTDNDPSPGKHSFLILIVQLPRDRPGSSKSGCKRGDISRGIRCSENTLYSKVGFQKKRRKKRRDIVYYISFQWAGSLTSNIVERFDLIPMTCFVKANCIISNSSSRD